MAEPALRVPSGDFGVFLERLITAVPASIVVAGPEFVSDPG